MFEMIWHNELAVGRVAVSSLLRDCWGWFPERMHMDLEGRHQSRGLYAASRTRLKTYHPKNTSAQINLAQTTSWKDFPVTETSLARAFESVEPIVTTDRSCQSSK